MMMKMIMMMGTIAVMIIAMNVGCDDDDDEKNYLNT